MPFLPPNCMVHDCLFIYIAAGRHIWRSFPYPPPGDAAGSLQKGPNENRTVTIIKKHTKKAPIAGRNGQFKTFLQELKGYHMTLT